MNALDALLRDEIARLGPLPFRRFMELALYHPEHGYYERDAEQIGRAGDFFTSVSVGSLFGELLAFRFAGWLESLARDGGPVQIVEAGAHDGALAADILGWLERQRPELFRTLEYCLVEPSPRRREWQRQRLQHFASKVTWRSQLSEQAAHSVSGVIFCNELLDAFPVHRLGWDATRHRWFEWAVTVAGEAFTWARLPLASGPAPGVPASGPARTGSWPEPELAGPEAGAPTIAGYTASGLEAAALQSLAPALAGGDFSALAAVLPDGFTFEYAPGTLAWWHAAAAALKRGWLVAFDYGLAAGEIIRPERVGGTLRAYSGHRVSQDLLAEPGRWDLTAHVNFAVVQAAGEAAGLRTEGLVSQENFLMRIAAEAMAAGGRFGEWNEPRSRQLRTLAHPNQMGRAFRVLTQTALELASGGAPAAGPAR